MSDRATTGLSLVGYRGTGKTTVGKRVADRLRLPFADADEAIERRMGQSIRQLFLEQGEAAFRDAEEATLRDLTARPGLVLATGGGAVLRSTNREALRRLGPVVWLRASPEVLAARLQADPRNNRPALTSAGPLAEIAEVLAQREPIYRALADVTIDTEERTSDEVAEQILQWWTARQGDGSRVGS